MVTSASFLEDPNGLVSSGEDGLGIVSMRAPEGTVMFGLGLMAPRTFLSSGVDMTVTRSSDLNHEWTDEGNLLVDDLSSKKPKSIGDMFGGTESSISRGQRHGRRIPQKGLNIGGVYERVEIQVDKMYRLYMLSSNGGLRL